MLRRSREVSPPAAGHAAAPEAAGVRFRSRLVANSLAVFLTVGGVAYGRSTDGPSNPAWIELCAKAGTRELLAPSLHGCTPPDRLKRVVRPSFRGKRRPLLLASLGPPAALGPASITSARTGTAADPVQPGATGSPAGPGGPVGVSCSTATAGLVGGIGPAGTGGPIALNCPAGSSTAGGVAGSGVGGTVGPTGPTGPVGPVGPAGFQGAAGSPGAGGAQGPAGAAGATGPQGPSGVAGVTGS
jgi:Collagen triple helix repeat (20 copies)